MGKQTNVSAGELVVQVTELSQTLEQTRRQLQRCELQLAASNQIRQLTAKISESKPRLQRLARLIKEQFQLYHVGLYLIDEAGQWAELAAAAGATHHKFKRAGNRLPLTGSSPAAWVSCHRRPRLVEPDRSDSRNDAEIKPFLLPKTRAGLILPLVVDKQLIGLLAAQSQQHDYFDQTNTAALQALADQVAWAIDQNQQLARTAAERDRLKLLYEMSTALSGDLDFDSIAAMAVSLADRLGAASGELHLLDEAGNLYYKSSYAERNQIDEARWKELVLRTLTQGLDAWVIKNRQTALVSDTVADERWLKIGHDDAMPAVRSAICAPIIVERSKLQGAISYVHPQPNHFNQQDLALLQTLATRIAGALENTTLLHNIQSNLEETRLILSVSRQLTKALNFKDVYKALTKGIMATGAERCTIYACKDLDANNIPQSSQIVFIDDVDPANRKKGLNDRFRVRDYPAFYSIAKSQEPLVIMDVDTDERLSLEEQELLQRFGTCSLIIIPLVAHNRVNGLASIEYRTLQDFSEQSITLYQTLCSQATIALENVRQVERTAAALAGTQSLYRAGRVLANTANVQETLQEALIEFLYSLNLDQGAITLLSPDRKYGQLVVYAENYELQDVARLRFPIDEEIPYQKILLSGQPFVSADAPNDDRLKGFISFNQETFPKSLLEAPLILKGETIGWIGADAVKEYRDFSEREIDLARAMADQVTIALQNHQLLEQTQRRANQFRAVAEVGEAVSGVIELDEVLSKTVNLIRDRFGFYHVSIFLVDQDRKWAVVRASTGEVGKIMVERPHRLAVAGQSIVGYVTGTGQPRIALDVGQDAVHFNNPLLPETRSEMALPLISRGSVIGALDVQSVEAGAFEEEDVNMLQTMANQLAAAIENARLFEQTQRRLVEQAMLYNIGTRVSSTLNLQEAAKNLVAETAEALNVAKCGLSLLGDDDMVTIISDRVKPGSAFPSSQGRRFRLNDSVVWPKVLRTKQELVVHIDELTTAQTQAEYAYLRQNHGTAMAIVPVLLRHKVIGFLELYDDQPGRRFSRENVSLLDSIALQAANAIQNGQLFEQAQASQAFMKSIIDEIPDPIFIKDREHKWVVVNRAFSNILFDGLPEEELIGRSDYDFSPKEEADWFWEQDEKTLASGEIQETEEQHTNPDGDIRILYTRKIPLRVVGQDGKPDYLVGIIHDITERKQREAERERLIDQIQQNLERTQALYRLSDALATATEPQATFKMVLHEYLQLLNLKQGAIMLLDQAGEYNQIAALYVDGQAIVADIRLPIKEDPIAQRLQFNPKPLVITDGYRHPLHKPELNPVLNEVMLFIPLIIQSKMGGMIVAGSAEADYTFAESDIALGETIADQLSIWLENRQLLAEAQYRTNLLQTAADVSRAASSILDVGELIETSVNLIRDKFDFYYVGLFLVDEAKEWAVLRAGTGEAGQIQLDRGHRLKIGGESMIGWAVANRQARIALDVGAEAVHFQNPYLPDTHSEMALPLVSRDEVIGALTVQSVVRGAFSAEDITVLQTMADQLANAISNARLYEATQRAARRESIIREISGRVRSATTVDDIMKTTVLELSKVLGATRGGITLSADPKEQTDHDH